MPTLFAGLAWPRRGAAVAALSALAFTGCMTGDTLTGTNNGGKFTATVSGDLQGTLAGNAEVLPVQGTSTSPAGIALGLVDPTGTVVAFKWPHLTAVAVGTTNVGTDTTLTAMTMVLPGNVAGRTFTGTSGSVTVTAATATSVTGTFSVVALAPDTNQTISMSGDFTAVVLGATGP